jgi:hypothetical protein
MSSTGQATTTTSNFQLIVDALADYAKVTGIDLSKNTFAVTLEQSNDSNSPEAILQLLQGREQAFKEYRDGNRRLISCLSPVVKVLQAFSGNMGEAVSLVSQSSGESFNVTLSDPLLTGKHIVCWDRCAPYCTSFEMPSNNSPVMYEYARLPVRLRQATMPCWISLNAWGISSSVWRYIWRSLPHQ